MKSTNFSYDCLFLIRTFVFYSSFIFFFVSCNPTADDVQKLVGEQEKQIQNGPLGNSALSFSPSLKDFGSLATNSGTSTQTFIVTNASSYNLTLGAITGATAHFSVSSGTCFNHSSLNKGESCSMSVTFAPTASGQFSSAISIPYDVSGSGTFYSAVSVIGAGTNLTSFLGLDSLSNETVTSMKLNWTDVVGADSYQAYRITASGSAILLSSMTSVASCVLGACSYTAVGLNPSTSYTFRVRATDSNTVQEQNIVNRSSTTMAGTLDLSGPAISLAGDCSLFQIITKDATGSAISVSTDTAITIGSLGNGALYTASNCAISLSSPTILSGQSSADFYYKNTTAQAITMSGSLTTYTPDTLAHTILSNVADHLSYVSGNNQTGAIDELLASSIVAKVVDAYENPVTGTSIHFYSPRGGAKPTNSIVVSDSNGLVSNTIRLGSKDTVNNIKLTRLGTILPDVAGSTNATLLFSATAQTTASNFLNSRLTTKESSPGGCSGDFNQDGYLDLAVTGETTGVVSVLINKGNGTFNTRVDYNLNATYGYNCTTGNINGDAFPDLIVAVYAAGGVTSANNVFINSGTGTFPTRADYIVASSGMTDVKLADFNGDSILDMVSVGYTAAAFYIRLGVGDGTFGASTSYAAGTGALSLVTGDFNGDGNLDAVTANYGTTTVSVIRGNGDGTFMAKVDYTVGTTPFNLAATDFNGDSILDIAVANFGSASVSILLGTGTAGSYTFLPKNDYATGTQPSSVGIADLTGDGVKDVIASNYGSGTMTLWTGVGNGSFSTSTTYPIGAGTIPQEIEMGDFDNNGKQDVVTFFRTGSISAANIFFQKTGTNGLRTSQIDLATTAIGYHMATGDFNGDGKQDIVHANYTASNKVSVFINSANGTGSFATKVDYTGGTNTQAGVAVGDVNNDNYLDIVSCDRNGGAGNSVSVFTGVGNGTFNARTGNTTAVDPWSVALGDLNNDGKLDIVTGNYITGNISILLGNGDATFNPKTDVNVSANPRSVGLIDLNNDKKLDVVVASNTTGKVGVLLGNGSGGFAAMVEYPVGGSAYKVRYGDFNSDSIIDLIAINTAANTVGLILGVGDGTFGAPTTFAATGTLWDLTVGDFNGDGKLDVVTAPSSGTGLINYFVGNGLGSFAATVTSNLQPATEYSYSVVSGDFNGDGKLDIATNSTPTAKVYVIPTF